MLTLRVNGTEYNNAIRITVERSLKSFCDLFTAVSSANSDSVLPVKMGDRIEVLADGLIVFTGFVEVIQARYSATEHRIAISGRSITCDLVDSSVKGDKEFNGSITLVDLIKLVVKDLGLDLTVINNSGINPTFKQEEITSAEVGESCFSFLEKYARRHQIILTSNHLGQIELVRASKASLGIDLYRLDNDVNNNIISADFTADFSKRFNTYKVQSQQSPLSLLGNEPEDLVSQSGEATDSVIRKTRFLEFDSEEEQDNETSFNRAAFEANIRRANSVNYSATIYGHSNNGQNFELNTLSNIQDNFAQVNSTMLLHTVKYSFDNDNGSLTTLDYTFQDAFTLQAERDQLEAKKESVGNGFF